MTGTLTWLVAAHRKTQDIQRGQGRWHEPVALFNSHRLPQGVSRTWLMQRKWFHSSWTPLVKPLRGKEEAMAQTRSRQGSAPLASYSQARWRRCRAVTCPGLGMWLGCVKKSSQEKTGAVNRVVHLVGLVPLLLHSHSYVVLENAPIAPLCKHKQGHKLHQSEDSSLTGIARSQRPRASKGLEPAVTSAEALQDTSGKALGELDELYEVREGLSCKKGSLTESSARKTRLLPVLIVSLLSWQASCQLTMLMRLVA